MSNSNSFKIFAQFTLGIAIANLLGLASVLYPTMTFGCYFVMLIVLLVLAAFTVSNYLKWRATTWDRGYQIMIPSIILMVIVVLFFFNGVSLGW